MIADDQNGNKNLWPYIKMLKEKSSWMIFATKLTWTSYDFERRDGLHSLNCQLTSCFLPQKCGTAFQLACQYPTTKLLDFSAACIKKLLVTLTQQKLVD